MNWVFFSLLALFFFSSSNILQLIGLHGFKSFKSDLLFIRLITIISGIIAFISFFIPGFTIDKNDLIQFRKNLSIPLLLAAGTSVYLGIMFKILAFNSGGSLALIIIYLNLIVSILFGVIFLKERINTQIIIGIIIYIGSAIFIIHNKYLLIKK